MRSKLARCFLGKHGKCRSSATSMTNRNPLPTFVPSSFAVPVECNVWLSTSRCSQRTSSIVFRTMIARKRCNGLPRPRWILGPVPYLLQGLLPLGEFVVVLAYQELPRQRSLRHVQYVLVTIL